MESILNSVISMLEGYKEPERLKFAAISYPTSMKVIGVVGANEKEIIKSLRAETKSFSARKKIDLAKSLVNTNIFECQHIAYEFLGKDRKTLSALSEEDLVALGKNLDNWVSVDGYGVYLVGFAWREGMINDQKIKKFLDSEDFWIRRTAIVATITLNQKARGGTGDAKRTIDICSMAVNDHHDMINKALSWALRELAKVDREPVIKFIEQYKDQLHPRVLREVNNKLTTGRKT